MAKSKRGRGRPPGGEYAGKSAVVHFRITPDTKALLERAAQSTGRTVSQECEYRLLRGLEDLGDEPTTAVLKIFKVGIDNARRITDPDGKAPWWSDPYTFELTQRAFAGLLGLFRPPGELPPTNDKYFELARSAFTSTAADVMELIQLADPTKPYAGQTRQEAWVSMRRKELGALADRPILRGRTAQERRKEHALLDAIRPLLMQLSPLEEIPENSRTPAQQKKLERLRQQIEEIERRS
jgi:hypothetical protein